MERYSYLQTMANSPLTPLTPLSENSKFEFNFGGDGSLDEYIDSVLQEHRVEQQRKKLLQQANQSFQKKLRPPLPRRYSQEFLKLRDVFECQGPQIKKMHCNLHKKPQTPGVTPKTALVKIMYNGTTPTAARIKGGDYANTPTNVRTPLQLKRNVAAKNLSAKKINIQQLQKLQQQMKQNPQTKRNRAFIQASPVAVKPLCHRVANILQQCGLTMYSGIFQSEEIDLLAFRLLRLQDLHYLGITNQTHCAILIKNIYELFLTDNIIC